MELLTGSGHSDYGENMECMCVIEYGSTPFGTEKE